MNHGAEVNQGLGRQLLEVLAFPQVFGEVAYFAVYHYTSPASGRVAERKRGRLGSASEASMEGAPPFSPPKTGKEST
jgi:hypothetical protein